MEQIYTPKLDYKVLVRCFTYNQAKYIEEALNGFAMQKTDFPFVCLVVDDCSIDGEQEVIKTWMERECDMPMAEYVEIENSNIILVPHKSNRNCSFAFYFLKQNMYKLKQQKMAMVKPWRAHCQYEAMCEGDDYWISPIKLQKQVTAMEADGNIVMSCTNGIVLWENNTDRAIVFNSYTESCLVEKEELIGRWTFPTAGLMYKTKLLNDWPSWTNKIYSGDLTIVLIAAVKGKVFAMSDIACVYRCNKSGNSVSMINGRDFVAKHHLMLYENYKEYANLNHCKVLDSVICNLKKEVKFWDIYRNNQFLSFIYMPGMYFKFIVLPSLKQMARSKMKPRITLS